MGDVLRGSAIAFRFPAATVSCPAGKKMVGGGGRCISLGNVGWVILIESRPENDNTWRVQCDTPEQQNVMAESYAVCQ